jgi:hypothetical protein
MMKPSFALLLGSFLVANSAQSALLTFDDIPNGGIRDLYGAVNRHNGFDFSETLYWLDLSSRPVGAGAHSGDFALMDADNGIGTITSSDSFDFSFDGLWAKKLSSTRERNVPTHGNIKGFNNGLEVWSMNAMLNNSYQFFAGMSAKIDTLFIDFEGLYLIDDLSLSQPKVALPEPSPFWLLSFGLAGLWFTRRWQQ